MQLFIAREALDPHLRVAGEVMNSKLPVRPDACGPRPAPGWFYLRWYPKQWLPAMPNTAGHGSRR